MHYSNDRIPHLRLEDVYYAERTITKPRPYIQLCMSEDC